MRNVNATGEPGDIQSNANDARGAHLAAGCPNAKDQAGPAMDLEQARLVIDDVDRQMAELFERRMGAVAAVAVYKMERGLPVLDSERERRVIERNASRVSDEIRPYYTQFLEQAMAVSRQYQHRLIEAAGNVSAE